MERNCAYSMNCEAPRAYRVTEKWDERVVYCCAAHYPGNRIIAPPVARYESKNYIIEPLKGAQ